MASAWGNNLWQLAALVICMFILMYGVGSGIEKANKVMMPIFFVLFVILGIYVAFQPGAAAGYRYIFRVEPEVLAKLPHGSSHLDRHFSPCLLQVTVH